MSTDIRIYVADLAAYNNGKLHGVWINACDDLDDIWSQINEMLAASPESFSEEHAIHDYEGFGGYGLSEYEGIEAAHEIACFIEEYPEIGGELLNNFGGNLDDARKSAEENYSGCYKSLADYAQKTANADHLDFVLKTYKSLPSNEFIEITPEIQNKLKAEISRTAVNSEQFFETVKNVPDDFLSPSTINDLIVGKAQKIWRVHLNFVFEKYASFPVYQIQLTKALKQQLEDELLRTDVSIAAILDHPDKPEDMNMLKAQALMQGKLDEIPQKHWDFMIKRYASVPNVEMIQLTKVDRDEFTRQLARTRMNYLRLSNHIKSKSGRKYKTTFLADLQKGKQTNIQRTIWTEIIGCLKALPNAPASTGGIKKETRPTQNKVRIAKNKILITEDMRQALNIELQRTGISIKSLLLGRPKSLKALTSAKISNWKIGRLLTADKQEWDYVLHILSIFPRKNITQ